MKRGLLGPWKMYAKQARSQKDLINGADPGFVNWPSLNSWGSGGAVSPPGGPAHPLEKFGILDPLNAWKLHVQHFEMTPTEIVLTLVKLFTTQ